MVKVEDLTALNYLVSFTIDALTGERQSLTTFNWYDDELGVTMDPDLVYENWLKNLDTTTEMYRNQHAEQMQSAIGYAQKHFGDSNVVKAAYESAMIDKNVTKIYFTITDEYNQEIEVCVMSPTGELISIHQQSNNCIPGYFTEDSDRTAQRSISQ